MDAVHTPPPTRDMVTDRGPTAWVARHQLAAFFLIAFAWSWTMWVPLSFGGAVTFFAGAFGPALAAVVVTHASGGSVRAWGRSILRWRVPARYYLYALGLPVLLYAVVNVVLLLLGNDLDPTLILDRAPGYLGMLVFVAVLGGGQEEPGWRGFALTRLQQRHSPVVATAILGLLWGIWHVPLYGPLGFVVPLVLAFFYTWLWNRTHSALLCLLLHGAFTPAQDLAVLMPDVVAHAGGLGAVDLAIFGTYLAGVAVLLVLTRGRLGADHAPAVDPTPSGGLTARRAPGPGGS